MLYSSLQQVVAVAQPFSRQLLAGDSFGTIGGRHSRQLDRLCDNRSGTSGLNARGDDHGTARSGDSRGHRYRWLG